MHQKYLMIHLVQVLTHKEYKTVLVARLQAIDGANIACYWSFGFGCSSFPASVFLHQIASLVGRTAGLKHQRNASVGKVPPLSRTFILLNSSTPRLPNFSHSVRSDVTGLLRAALTAWRLMVSSAMSKAAAPAPAKIHQSSAMR